MLETSAHFSHLTPLPPTDKVTVEYAMSTNYSKLYRPTLADTIVLCRPTLADNVVLSHLTLADTVVLYRLTLADTRVYYF